MRSPSIVLCPGPPAGISAVIPARNEAPRVGAVVTSALGARSIDQVIVVANDCSDDTAAVARASGAHVHELATPGKGEAIMTGMRLAPQSDAILLLDADLVGLTPDHIDSLTRAVLEGEADMVCGILAGRFLQRDFVKSWPLSNFWTLTGQRCLRTELLSDLRTCDIAGYRIEATLNRRCVTEHRRVLRSGLHGVRHITKERKGAIPGGTLSTLQMILAVYWTYVRLGFRQVLRRPLVERATAS